MGRRIHISLTLFIALVFTAVAFLLALFLFGYQTDYSRAFLAEKGLLSLSSGDFDYNISLLGEWKYFENRLIHGSESSEHEFEYVSIPHFLDGGGYGTYELRIEGLEREKTYSLYIPDFSSAYVLYLNNREISRNGEVSSELIEERLHWVPKVVNFEAQSNSIVFHLQISSLHTYPGGLMRELRLGNEYLIRDFYIHNVINQVILLGGVLIIALYNLCLFLLNRHDKPAGFFAILNFIVALRIMLTGEKIINYWFHDLNWYPLIIFQFTLGSLMLLSFVLFIHSLFPEEFNKRVVGGLVLFSAALAIVSFTVPLRFLAPADYAFLAATSLFFLYTLIILIKAIIKRVEGSVFSFIGICFILGTVALDATMPPGSNIISIGIFIFTIFQSLVIAERHSKVVEENKELSRVATRDGMTNLYKKEHFRELVSSLIEKDDSLMHHAMLFVDIDNFKTVNDTYGHDIGDELIIAVAETLIYSLRYSDLACRYGGDEFVLWLQNTKPEEVKIIGRRILENVSKPLTERYKNLQVSISMGISFYPDDGSNFDTMLKVCDKRMYKAKKSGKNQLNLG